MPSKNIRPYSGSKGTFRQSQGHLKEKRRKKSSSLLTIKQLLMLRIFARRVVKQFYQFQYTKLKDLHLKIIGDLTVEQGYSQNKNGNTNIFRKLYVFKKVSQMMGLVPIFEPLSNLKLYWDLWVIFLICAYFVAIPLVIGLNMKLEYFLGGDVIHYMFLIFLFMDLLVILNTGYFDKGIIVKNRKKISNNYLNNGFYPDLVSMLTVTFYKLYNSWTEEYEDINWTQLIFYLKVFNFKRIYRRIEMRFRLKPQVSNLFNLFKLLILVIYICHVFACIWIYVARKQKLYSTNWIIERNLFFDPWNTQYLHAFYFMTVTMVTVGYGDMLPTNNLEVFLCILTMLIACGVFAYAMNEIGLVLEKLQQEQEQIDKNLYIINNYMKKKKVRKELQYQVVEYLQYFYSQQSPEDGEREEIIIDQLNQNLKEDLLIDSNKIVLEECKLFKDNFSIPVILDTIPLIKEQIMMPEDTILDKDGEEDSIYFIEKGAVDISLRNHQDSQEETRLKEIYTLREGEYFGELSFFTGQDDFLTVKSKEFTNLLRISRSEFLRVLKEHDKDNEKFCYIRDCLKYSNELKKIGLKCFSCEQTDHTINFCPLIQPIRNKRNIQRKFLHSFEQIRNIVDKSKRYRKNYYHTLLSSTEVVEQVRNFISTNHQMVQEVSNLNNYTDYGGDSDDFDDTYTDDDDDYYTDEDEEDDDENSNYYQEYSIEEEDDGEYECEQQYNNNNNTTQRSLIDTSINYSNNNNKGQNSPLKLQKKSQFSQVSQQNLTSIQFEDSKLISNHRLSDNNLSPFIKTISQRKLDLEDLKRMQTPPTINMKKVIGQTSPYDSSSQGEYQDGEEIVQEEELYSKQSTNKLSPRQQQQQLQQPNNDKRMSSSHQGNISYRDLTESVQNKTNKPNIMIIPPMMHINQKKNINTVKISSDNSPQFMGENSQEVDQKLKSTHTLTNKSKLLEEDFKAIKEESHSSRRSSKKISFYQRKKTQTPTQILRDKIIQNKRGSVCYQKKRSSEYQKISLIKQATSLNDSTTGTQAFKKHHKRNSDLSGIVMKKPEKDVFLRQASANIDKKQEKNVMFMSKANQFHKMSSSNIRKSSKGTLERSKTIRDNLKASAILERSNKPMGNSQSNLNRIAEQLLGSILGILTNPTFSRNMLNSQSQQQQIQHQQSASTRHSIVPNSILPYMGGNTYISQSHHNTQLQQNKVISGNKCHLYDEDFEIPQDFDIYYPQHNFNKIFDKYKMHQRRICNKFGKNLRQSQVQNQSQNPDFSRSHHNSKILRVSQKIEKIERRAAGSFVDKIRRSVQNNSKRNSKLTPQQKAEQNKADPQFRYSMQNQEKQSMKFMEVIKAYQGFSVSMPENNDSLRFKNPSIQVQQQQQQQKKEDLSFISEIEQVKSNESYQITSEEEDRIKEVKK